MLLSFIAAVLAAICILAVFFFGSKTQQSNHQKFNKRRKLKNKKPYPIVKNKIWGIDLTFVRDKESNTNTILGVCEHHSRLAVSLTTVKDKASITILRVILDAIEKHEKPKIIRTDNEAIFTSKLFKCALSLLNIKHQTTQLYSPWQNGRIERLFGTLKYHLQNHIIPNSECLRKQLAEFQWWYNSVRPHQNLSEKTLNEVWHGIDVFKTPKRHHKIIT